MYVRAIESQFTPKEKHRWYWRTSGACGLICAALCLKKQKYISRFLEVMELNNLLINGIMQTEKALQRIKQVIQRTGLPRSTLYYLMGKGEFPKPVKIAARAVAWDSEKVTAWIESRLSA